LFFWDDYLFDYTREAVVKFIAIRKEAGINSKSSLYVSQANQGVYAAFVQGSYETVAVKIGRGDWSPKGSGWQILAAGDSYAVWKNSANFTPYVSS